MVLHVGQVLSQDGLTHIAEHKYVPGSYTPLDNLLNPFWAACTEFLPLWLAPNLVSLLCFLPMLMTFAMAWRSCPDFATPPTRTEALLTAFATWFYQTMDAMDGKQARRTKSSSPLGQLFDHGCDCLTCIAQHSVAGWVLLPGSTRWVLLR